MHMEDMGSRKGIRVGLSYQEEEMTTIRKQTILTFRQQTMKSLTFIWTWQQLILSTRRTGHEFRQINLKAPKILLSYTIQTISLVDQ